MTPLAQKMTLSERQANLESHLQTESPALLESLPTFYKLDKLLQRMGLLNRDDSLATRIPWWPLISVLGTFSSGKSTFINDYLDEDLQATGNQAVDDMFTVICYGPGDHQRVLPGMALDADPRFPFYRMSDEIEEVMAGEGKRIDSYLQLKTAAAARIKGNILIDSPGFDADDQRRSTLKITDHIIDLSDLVLVFFDARHPEPGAMQDTLDHLVSKTVKRPDSGKFMYVLNQIDTTAREDNPEEVVGAWQRAVAQAGLASGRFYTIYNEKAAAPMEDAALKARYQSKRDIDLAEIHDRIEDVGVERNYRIIGVLQTVADEVERELVPAVEDAMESWRNRVLLGDAFWVAAMVTVLGALVYKVESLSVSSIMAAFGDPIEAGVLLVSLAVVLFAGHFWMRSLAQRSVAAKLPDDIGQVGLDVRSAFMKNTRFFRSVFRSVPTGWGRGARKKMRQVRDAAAAQVQKLNDLYTDPSGDHQISGVEPAPAEMPAAAAAEVVVSEPPLLESAEPTPSEPTVSGAAVEVTAPEKAAEARSDTPEANPAANPPSGSAGEAEAPESGPKPEAPTTSKAAKPRATRKKTRSSSTKPKE